MRTRKILALILALAAFAALGACGTEEPEETTKYPPITHPSMATAIITVEPFQLEDYQARLNSLPEAAQKIPKRPLQDPSFADRAAKEVWESIFTHEPASMALLMSKADREVREDTRANAYLITGSPNDFSDSELTAYVILDKAEGRVLAIWTE
ncbi:MAG: hypothetical protein FWH26_07075 [Oscillospiraceae bacterium]|nr:hypothetical protein [Oscillospiraceae bacterium]